MAFGDNLFQAGSQSVPVPATIVPQWRLIGDYWTFAVAFTNPDGSAAVMAGQTPGAVLEPGYGQADIPLSILAPVSGDAANLIRFGIQTDVTKGGVIVVPQGQSTAAFPVRFQAFLTDSFGHRTTYSVTPIIAADPRKVDLNALPAPATVISTSGPAGPQGITGIAASADQIQAAVANAIPSVVIATLDQQGLPDNAGTLLSLIDSRIRLILSEFSNTGQLVGTIQGASTLSGAISVQVLAPLTGVIQGQSTLTGTLAQFVSLAGMIQGQSTLSGQIYQSIGLAGTIQGASVLQGSVTQSVMLAGVINGASQLTASLTATPPSSMLSGVIQGQSTLSGSVSQSVALAGTIQGKSTLAGSLLQTSALAGSIQGQSTLRGSLSQSVQLVGAIQGGSVLSGSVTRAYGFVGVIQGGSTLTGALTVVPAQKRSPSFGFLFLDAA